MVGLDRCTTETERKTLFASGLQLFGGEGMSVPFYEGW